MATEILKSFGTLQSELEQAKSSLKGVDENIKRLIGRDPSQLTTPGQRHIKRSNTNASNNEEGGNKHRWGLGGNRRVFTHENDEPPVKRRGGVFNRLSDRFSDRDRSAYQDDDNSELKGHNKQMISKVIVTPKEVPSRQEALDAQSGDEQFKARNRRMFGALLGTLQKFQQEETKLKPKEEKRAQLEKKIEEIEIREKAEIKKERQELFMNRKKKQAEIKMIELKMQKMKTYAKWEETQKMRMNFIQTKSKPCIHYLPKKMNDESTAALKESKKNIEKLIEERKQEVFQELQVIEEKMSWSYKKTTIKSTAENESDKESDDENNDEEDHKKDELDSTTPAEVKMEEDEDEVQNESEDIAMNPTEPESNPSQEKVDSTISEDNTSVSKDADEKTDD